MTTEQIASILSDANIGNVQVIETGLQRCPVQVTLVAQPNESQQDQFTRLDRIEAALQQAGVRAWCREQEAEAQRGGRAPTAKAMRAARGQKPTGMHRQAP